MPMKHSKYSVIMVDEAHERSLNIDFILGLLKRVLQERKDFKVIVSSATINTALFSIYFDDCPVVKIDAVSFPVSIIYDEPERNIKLRENLKSKEFKAANFRNIKQNAQEWEEALLRADPQLIQTLLYNLADNARKAMDGPLRQILIRGRLTPEGYRVTVADTGRGIPADQLSRITEPFYMVDKSRARSQGGAGLGLALCQRIALLHGSKLEFLSRPGEGTAVSFTLPLAGESRPAAPLPSGPDGMGPAESAAPSDPSRPGPGADAPASPQPAPHDSFREVNP